MGSGTTKQKSRPLTVEERMPYYDMAMNLFGGKIPGKDAYKAPKLSSSQFQSSGPFNSPGAAPNFQYSGPGAAPDFQYSGPDITSAKFSGPGEFAGFKDFDRLEQQVLQSRLAPVERQLGLDRDRVNQDMADRGIYSSGLAVGAQNDLSERYAPAFQQAGADAALQRYSLEADENAGRNAWGQSLSNAINQNRQFNAGLSSTNAGMANQYGLADASRRGDYNMGSANMANQYGMADASRRGDYNMGSADMANQYQLGSAGMANQFSQGNANMANQFNLANAQQGMESQWRPSEYLAGLWGSTAANTSQGIGKNWSI
jgi:hypothetical protein